MDMRFIEVCIGLVLVFALTSLLVTTVTEIYASARGRRGANLELALRSMLADDPKPSGMSGLFMHRQPSAFTQALLDHPLMVSQSQGIVGQQGKPSYLPGDLVVSVLLDQLAKATPGMTRPETPRLLLNALTHAKDLQPQPPTALLQSLEALAQGVDSDWQAYERRLVAWFDSVGERSIGWYKRWNQMRLATFGFLTALLLNINPFLVAERLWNEEPLRRATVAAAESAHAALAPSQAASAPDMQTLQRILERVAASAPASPSGAASAPLPSASSSAPSGFGNGGTAATARTDGAMNRLRAELYGAQGRDPNSLVNLAKMVGHEADLRVYVHRRRASLADTHVPEELLGFSALVEEKLQLLSDLAAQSRLSSIEGAARDARAALLAERADLLVQALPAGLGNRCRSASTAEARAVCERIEGVRSLGDAGLPIGWRWENLPGCEDGQCDLRPGARRAPEQVRDDLRKAIAQLDRVAPLEPCRDAKLKALTSGCDGPEALRLDAARRTLDEKLTAHWRDAAADLKAPALGAAAIAARCASGDVPCSRTMMFLGWLVIGIASVLGAPFWFDVLGRLIQLRGSGARPADGAKSSDGASASGGGAPTGPGSGMLTPPSQPGDVTGLQAGSMSALSAAERELTADQIASLQKEGLGMPPALVTSRFDTETRTRIVQWQAAEQQAPADGVLTNLQVQRLMRGAAPSPAQPSPPVAPVARGATPVRTDGTIAPLTEQEIRDIYGDIATAPASAPGAHVGSVRVVTEGKPGGPQRVLDALSVPASMAARFPAGLMIHRRVKPHLEAVLNDIDAKGLATLILSCQGTVVERHIGWDPRKRLSSHTWGIAIDINAPENQQGSAPAAKGAVGSVCQLVPIFNNHGFAWGGDFRNGGPDGMHFELALRSP